MLFVKIDAFEECEAYAETSAIEEDEEVPAKRTKKVKSYPDCVTGIFFFLICSCRYSDF